MQISFEPPRFFALIPCAGRGERSGLQIPKQYAELAGQTLIGHVLNTLHQVERLAGVMVVLSPDDETFTARHSNYQGWTCFEGGATRAHSVAAGIQALIEQGAQVHDWVLVHDAARCLIRPEWIERLMSACEDDEVGGLLALPIADTIKQAQDGRSVQTVDRSHKWQAQTPQMFRIGLLKLALTQALSEDVFSITDEASAIEVLGHQPKLVEGAWDNFKLTWPSDFQLAKELLRLRQTGNVTT